MLPIFQWCESSALGVAIRNSVWLFPVIESIHLLALAVIGGAILVVDLRLLGLGLRKQPVGQLGREVHPWVVGSLVIMICTGVPLFTSEAMKCYYNPAFAVKMVCLLLAIVFTFTVRRRVIASEGRPIRNRLTALTSLSLWFSVGAAGRWIGFSG